MLKSARDFAFDAPGVSDGFSPWQSWSSGPPGNKAGAPAVPGSSLPDAASPGDPDIPTPFATSTWDGVTQAISGFRPPDSDVAAGTRHVLTTTNGNLSLYTRTGTLLSSQTLNQFFGVANTRFVFDPHVLWDQYSGRFVVAAADHTGNENFTRVAVSRTSDPADGWNFLDVNTAVGTDWLDFPTVSLDGNNLYITGPRFTATNVNTNTHRLYTFNLNTLEAGGTPTVHSYDTLADILYTSFPGMYVAAHTYGHQAGVGTGTYLINYSQSNTGDDYLDVVRVDSSGATPAFFHTGGDNFGGVINIGNISDATPAGSRQQGTATTFESGRSRILNAVWRDNRLYAVTEIRVGSGADAHDVVHWFQLDTSNPNDVNLIAQGNIDYGNNRDTSYGNLTVDTQGNMIIGFTYSGTDSFPSSAYRVIGGGDTGVFLAQGLGPYTELTNGRVRWGDYSGMSIDPLTNRGFWVYNQHATATNQWATRVGGHVAPNPSNTADFNASGTSDILLQGGSTVVNWTLRDGVYAGGNVLSTALPAGWQAAGTGDFNRDGIHDVLLQGDGLVVAWFLNTNGQYQGGTVVTPTPLPSGWQVVGTGDVNGDGVTDIVLQNGSVVVDWLLNNAGQYSTGNLLSNTLPAGWQVVGVGDLNASGNADIVIQGGNTVVDWILNGSGQYVSGNVLSTTLPAGWSVRTLADVNGDGTSDVVIQGGSNVVDWIINNGTYASGNVLSTTLPAGWSVMGSGDFNADGTSDVAIQGGSNVVNWLLDDGRYMSGNVLSTTLPTGWGVVGKT